MCAIGIVAAAIASFATNWLASIVVGWTAAAAVYSVMVWVIVLRMDGPSTRLHARREDPGLRTSEVLVIVATLISLAAVILLVISASNDDKHSQIITGLIAFVGVTCSWFLVHTLFTLRYAREYYADPVGGVEFQPTNEPPPYIDFAYVAFGIGMTYQVADTALTTSAFRRLALQHSLLAYVYGTGVLASVVNLLLGMTS